MYHTAGRSSITDDVSTLLAHCVLPVISIFSCTTMRCASWSMSESHILSISWQRHPCLQRFEHSNKHLNSCSRYPLIMNASFIERVK
jgi:hypothetical protein